MPVWQSAQRSLSAQLFCIKSQKGCNSSSKKKEDFFFYVWHVLKAKTMAAQMEDDNYDSVGKVDDYDLLLYFHNRDKYRKFVQNVKQMRQDIDKLKAIKTTIDSKESAKIQTEKNLALNIFRNQTSGELTKEDQKRLVRLKGFLDTIVANIHAKKKAVREGRELYELYTPQKIQDILELSRRDFADYSHAQLSKDALDAMSLEELNELKRENMEFKQAVTEGSEMRFGTYQFQPNDNYEKDNDMFLREYKRFLRSSGLKDITKENVIPSVKNAPLVTIFEGGYQPTYFAIGSSTAADFESRVKGKIGVSNINKRYSEICAEVDQPSQLTLAQKTPFYYSNPDNPTSILLNHSAGSGKTAAMTLACSLFVRAGYLPIIVTTEALQKDETYERAIFVECADWNIQQLLAANGQRSMIDLVDKTSADPTMNDVIARGKELYQSMADPNIWKPELKMTFPEFSKICFNFLKHKSDEDKYEPPYHILNSYPAFRVLHDHSKNGPVPGNIFWKTVILMDELQTMMDTPPPANLRYDPDRLDNQAVGDIRNVILALWESRRHSSGPVVIAASATPGNDACDLALILNLLCKREDGWQGFSNQKLHRDQGYYPNKDQIKLAFDNQHPDPQPLLSRMALGRVSYYDFSGSKSVPPMKVIDVQVELSGSQKGEYNKLLGDLRQLVTVKQDSKGRWTIEKGFTNKYSKNPAKSISTTRFAQDAKRNAIVPLEKKNPDHRRKIINQVTSEGSLHPPTRNTTREQWYERWYKEAKLVSPLYVQTIDLIQKNKYNGVQKQFVYINLNDNVDEGSELFCAMLGSLLNYKEVDRKAEGTYDGTYARVTKSNVAEMIDKFNSPENATGSVIDIIVLNRETKEGVSLYGVGAVFIVGVVDSETDLIQSVARAFRNCRTDPAKLYGSQQVPVTVMTPYIDGSPIHEILIALNKTKSLDRGHILKEASFDRKVLEQDNQASSKVQAALTQILK
jgi:hypothetical protein